MFKNKLINILLIEDEEFDVKRIKKTLEAFSAQIRIEKIVADGSTALEMLSSDEFEFDIVIMDYQITGGIRGEELIRKLKGIDPCIQIIVITKMTVNITDYSFADKLIQAGAFWYCTKYPGDIEEYIYQPTDFILSIFNAYQKKVFEKERLKSNEKIEKNINDILNLRRLIGESESIVKIKADIEKCASSDVPTIISGDSGTGKELVAYNIHYQSKRKYENFVPINCGSLPHDLVESELFGYEKGAFTGAHIEKPGLFELANNGTIFLDEITELPLAAQVKLLRVIQDGQLEKLGRTENVKVNVRIISATNKNIEEEVKAKRFREDLYYRLNVVSLSIPPLRERKEDILLLLDHFLTEISIDMGKEKPRIDDDAAQFFYNYSWPGNVREIKNVVQRLLFSGDNRINLEVATRSTGMTSTVHDKNEFNSISFPKPYDIISLKEMERLVREKYFAYVRETSSSDTEAAKKLGLAPPNFHRMCKELGLK
ncbi:MAG: sigma-54-dependent Fis family transcriptional regulator [Ignavibacterium sp.]|nr:MAG: sigma-54-dependent Fis family transcriptional regulator [Ignavibacterium sp.]